MARRTCASTIRKKDGKVHRDRCLVRSVRVGRRVIQQTVAHLGELDERGRIEARALARRLIGTPEQTALFDDGSDHLTAPVRLKGVRIERSRRFGDVYLALALWRGSARGAVRAAASGGQGARLMGEDGGGAGDGAAGASRRANCTSPSTFTGRVLCDLLGVPMRRTTTVCTVGWTNCCRTRRLGGISRSDGGELFALEYDLLLYDVTSTYFEGQAKANPLAKHGYSRDHRPDCKQVCIGLVVTRAACRWATKCSPGIGTIHDLADRRRRPWSTAMAGWTICIADRGMASADNLAWLRRPAGVHHRRAESELRKVAASDGRRKVKKASRSTCPPFRDGRDRDPCRRPTVAPNAPGDARPQPKN